MRKGCAKRPNDARYEGMKRGGRHDAYAEAALLAPRRTPYCFERAVVMRERRARSIEENPPGFGQFDPARLAPKQLDIELGLDRLDPLAERWLLHTEPLGCPGNVSLFGDNDEVPKVSQLHCYIHFDMNFG